MSSDPCSRCSEQVRRKYLSFPTLTREFQQTLEGEAEYCILDFETTGFDPVRDRVIEVAGVRLRGGEITGRCASLIDPGVRIPTQIRLLTGIDDEMVSGAPTMEEYFPTLQELIGDLPVVGYSRLELGFLSELYASHGGARFENHYIDAMDLAIMLMPSLRSHRQSDLAGLWGIDTGDAHRAGDDAETLARVFEYLLNGLYNTPLPLLKALVDHSPARPGGFSSLLARALAERAAGRPVDNLKLDGFLPRDRYWEEIPPLVGEQCLTVLPADEVRNVFAVDGPLAGQFDDYEERDEQLQMAEAARKAFADHLIMLVEAGTGTGKSLAYLVPAVMWAKQCGMPVVVSTRTLNLQDQLFTNDLPLLDRAWGGDSFRYTVLKGYGNYVCLRKLQALINGRKNIGEDQLGVLGMLITWLGEGGSGDVSMLNVSYLRGLDYQVLADHRECPGDRCAFARSGDCYYRKALYRAKRSHIVVVNHSLLLTGVNLAFQNAIIDEAHTLEDVATEQFTAEVDYRETRRFLEHLNSPLEGAGFLVDLADAVSRHVAEEAVDAALAALLQARESVETCLEDKERLFVALSEFYPGDQPGTTDIRFNAAAEDSIEYLRLTAEAERLASSLSDLTFAMARVATALADRGDDSTELDYVKADLSGKMVRVAELEAALGLVFGSDHEGLVRWATAAHPGRFEYQGLRASPIDVGPNLEEALYTSLDALVMTSATLSVKGTFDFFRSRVGLDLIDPDRVQCMVLDSSFDYERQMQILILHDMPEPGSRAYEGEIAGVLDQAIRSAGGGALVLFTNRRLMLETYGRLVDDLRRDGFKVLCQQPGHSRRRLAEEFIDDPGSSLFGTTSFWEGVDARGSTLKLVVVTRIPFESPGRPVFEARSERVRQQGLSDFSELSLPLAALRLKQGVGRLIRTRQDKGQVLIIDSRINSKHYGQVLLRSLPAARRRKVSLDDVGRAIADFHGTETDD